MAGEARYAEYYEGMCPLAPEKRYHEWLARAEAVVGRGRLLEVGAGRGGFVRVALERGWQVDATEVSRSGVEILRRTGARVHCGDLVGAVYPTASFDLTVSLEVIEHLPSPLEHLQQLARFTRGGGLLLLTTPNFSGLTRRLRGLRWRVIDPEHLGYFVPRTLGRALHSAGYSSVRVRTRSIDMAGWRAGAACEPARFDAQASAELRERVEGSDALRALKNAVNLGLSLGRLGDSLLAWARR